ncbi:MAG: penicillin-binding transpeptidase domain-containing protein, partial [Planctomycetota bacterium]|nr:penicillin-binding transpeptidase domain-containing protein [Planctomycetota bacterium]
MKLTVTLEGDSWSHGVGQRGDGTASSLTERVLDAMGPDGVTPLASRLIGKVRSPYLVDVLADRPERERLATLRRKLELPEDDREQILRLIDDSYRPGERVGASGLEAWLDEELRGKNGVFEEQGLQDRVAGNRDPIYRGAEDGQDVVLTLDVGLQRAAESVLMAPVYPTKDTRADPEWFERPVGAIVLATVEGEILAAASWPAVPDKRDDEVARRRDGEQKNARERTLGRATGMSPGSVVKPLMAAYALQFLGLDRSRSYVCDADEPRLGAKAEEKRESNRWLHAGWGKVNCNSRLGHSRKYGRINMRDALCYSCNVYFAGIAEELFDPGHMMKAYETFGFG